MAQKKENIKLFIDVRMFLTKTQSRFVIASTFISNSSNASIENQTAKFFYF